MGGWDLQEDGKGKAISSEDVQAHRSVEIGEQNTPGRHRFPVPTIRLGVSQHKILTCSQKPWWGIKCIYATTAPPSGVVEFFFFNDLVRIIQDQLYIVKIPGNKSR